MIQITGANSPALRAAAERAAAEFGARLVVLFGSTARGETTARDLDVGLLGDAPLDAVAVTNALTRQLGTQAVDVADLRRADPVLLALVARDGEALYEREPGEFSRFVSVAMRRFADTRKFRDARPGFRSAGDAGRP
jgi:predicted nucleotidyltransferase